MKDIKEAERDGKIQNSLEKKKWKDPITKLLKKEKKFLSAGEVRKFLKANHHIYPHLRYLKLSGALTTKIVENKVYYGLKEWE